MRTIRATVLGAICAVVLTFLASSAWADVRCVQVPMDMQLVATGTPPEGWISRLTWDHRNITSLAWSDLRVYGGSVVALRTACATAYVLMPVADYNTLRADMSSSVLAQLVLMGDWGIQAVLILAFLVGAVVGYRLMYRRGNV